MGRIGELYLLGAGGHARETLQLIEDLGRRAEVRGLFEEKSKRGGQRVAGVPVEDVSKIKSLSKSVRFIAAIGSPERRRLIESVESSGFRFETLIHPTVTIHSSVSVGEGTMICARSNVTVDVKIGRHVIVNVGALLHHDCVIGDYCTIGPGAVICGNVRLGSGCVIGAGATVIEKVTIGEGTIVGAGACVVEDLPPGALAVGVPARPKPRQRMD